MSASSFSRRDALFALGGAALGGVGTYAWTHRQPAAPPRTAALAHGSPEQVGFDARRLQVAYDLLEGYTRDADNPIPGGTILVGRQGKIVPPRFFGKQGPEADAPAIRSDGLFLLASITKPICYLGALILVERGQLRLHERVDRYLPEFTGGQKDKVLVSHLFTHTSGLPDMLENNVELRSQNVPLQRFLDGAVRDTTLAFTPGTRLSYQSMGTAAVAEIIQRISGQPIREFLQREIFTPLNLRSTALGRGDFPVERLVRVQAQPEQETTNYHWNTPYWQNLGVPWGGLFSTPEDFAVLCQLLLNGGSWNGVRLLSSGMTRMATTNRLHDYADLPEPIRRTQPWGLGWKLNAVGQPDSWGDNLGPQAFGHTGATGTLVWMDPRTGGYAIIWTTGQRSRAPGRLVRISSAIAGAFL